MTPSPDTEAMVEWARSRTAGGRPAIFYSDLHQQIFDLSAALLATAAERDALREMMEKLAAIKARGSEAATILEMVRAALKETNP